MAPFINKTARISPLQPPCLAFGSACTGWTGFLSPWPQPSPPWTAPLSMVTYRSSHPEGQRDADAELAPAEWPSGRVGKPGLQAPSARAPPAPSGAAPAHTLPPPPGLTPFPSRRCPRGWGSSLAGHSEPRGSNVPSPPSSRPKTTPIGPAATSKKQKTAQAH